MVLRLLRFPAMTTYVGLTDNPDRRRGEHGNPSDWIVEKIFLFEFQARSWEKQELAKPGHTGGTGGAGWRYGYKYTVTAYTRE